MVSSIIAQNSTSYGQISSKPKPRPHIAKAKARGSLRPRPQNFVVEAVLEHPIPAFGYIAVLFCFSALSPI